MPSTPNSWFYLRLGGQPTDKVENVFLCSTPIDAMSAATFLMHKCFGLPPTRTMFMVADDPNNLPMEFLKDTDKVFLTFNNDSQGNSTASAVFLLLPHSKKVTTFTPDWSQELEAHLREEQQKRRQQDRGFSLWATLPRTPDSWVKLKKEFLKHNCNISWLRILNKTPAYWQ